MIKRYGFYSTAITGLLVGAFFLNEYFFYGTAVHLWISMGLCVLFGLQFLIFLYNGIRIMIKYKIHPVSIAGAGIIIPLIFSILGGALVFGGGVLNTDTGIIGI